MKVPYVFLIDDETYFAVQADPILAQKVVEIALSRMSKRKYVDISQSQLNGVKA